MRHQNSRRNFIKKSATLALGTLAINTIAGNLLSETASIKKDDFEN
jgi:hypothetical protein